MGSIRTNAPGLAAALLAVLAAGAPVRGQSSAPLPPQPGEVPSPGVPAGLPQEVPPTVDTFEWTTWWNLHREAFLLVKEVVQGPGAASGDDGFYLGEGQRRSPPPSMRPDREVLSKRVVPALVRVLADERDDDLIQAAALALAKTTGPGGVPLPAEGRARLLALLRHPSRDVAEVGLLALGIVGEARDAPLLAAVLLDRENGRAALGVERVRRRDRALAALALGTLARRSTSVDVRRYVVLHLVATLDGEQALERDVSVACLLAFGLVPLPPAGSAGTSSAARTGSPTAGLEGQIAWLEGFLGRRNLPDAVRAFAVVAYARLAGRADTATRERAVRRLSDLGHPFGGAERETRRAAAIGLGLVGADDRSAPSALARAALLRQARYGETLERALALLSLARNAGRRGPGPESGASVEETRGFLIDRLTRGRSTERPWAALALALLERARPDGGSEVSREVLRKTLARAGSPRDVGALCTALGLLGDPRNADLVAPRLASGDLEVRGHAAVALGLMGARDAGPLLRALVAESTFLPRLLLDAATGLGLLRDHSLVPELTDALSRAAATSSQAALGLALGRIGDARAVGPLLEALEDRSLTTGARAAIATALGIVCDDEPYAWNVPLALDLPYGAAPAFLLDPLAGRGALDLP